MACSRQTACHTTKYTTPNKSIALSDYIEALPPAQPAALLCSFKFQNEITLLRAAAQCVDACSRSCFSKAVYSYLLCSHVAGRREFRFY